MKKTATITWVILMALTMVSALVSKLENSYALLIILLLSAFKFYGIAFQFMEMKKAHPFWKISLGLFTALFFVLIIVFNVRSI
ncbi:cytochrome C oxidase subunit IV family protein [Tamlana sp. 2201CG12-4]|uniref:cytochrome C oxidase subunit IV family protein n=1 Tax=Tamlana sp. 2201CG12-4 TaxID=3112582 RepID=UPI002DBAC782|nr:cytochrome C oxidase subunit IV family protein [Tamlana sp. 2201CG12-4]MEC3905895.1 cytochrome C oxidase subunit IV family protein [Tamlana sp. 2201CG12-4]